MPAASNDVLVRETRVAGTVAPLVTAFVVLIAVAIFGAVLAIRGDSNTGHSTATQPAAAHDLNAQKNRFSSK